MSQQGDGEQHGERPIGDVVDALGVTASLNPDELPAAAVVLLTLIQDDGSTRLVMAGSDGLGWIERVGMLRVAERIESDCTPDRS